MKTQANIPYEEIPEEQEMVGPRVLELASRMRMSHGLQTPQSGGG